MNDPHSTNHRLSLNIRITLGRISRIVAMKEEEAEEEEKEKEEEEEAEEEKEDQAARITHWPTKRFTRARFEDSYRLRLDTSSTTYDEGRRVHRFPLFSLRKVGG